MSDYKGVTACYTGWQVVDAMVSWLSMMTDLCLIHLEGFASGLSDFSVGIAQHAHQAFQQLWKVLQHVNVWYTGQNTDPADQKLPLVGIDHC